MQFQKVLKWIPILKVSKTASNFKLGQGNPWQMDQKNIKNKSKIKVLIKMSVINRTGWKENVWDLIYLIQLLYLWKHYETFWIKIL